MFMIDVKEDLMVMMMKIMDLQVKNIMIGVLLETNYFINYQLLCCHLVMLIWMLFLPILIMMLKMEDMEDGYILKILL